ncbi:MAG: CcmD family protein [Melioribacteraceae bacterium]|nr:CcmD family protein [Melioribacteraceae bacterium]
MGNGLIEFLEKNSIYIVMFIILVVWIGIFLFMLNTEKHLKNIEKELDSGSSKGKEN